MRWIPLKAFAAKSLAAVGLYAVFKRSDLYDLYCAWFLRDHWKKFQAYVAFFSALVGKDALVFDIGANTGGRADVYRRFARQVVCVEPDWRSFHALRERFARRANVTLLQCAVGETPGRARFYVEHEGSSFNTLSDKWKTALERANPSRFGQTFSFREGYEVEVTTLDRLIERYGMPDFIKLDVEGFEVNALRGLTRGVRHIEFEVNLPEFAQEAIECAALLERLSPVVQFRYSLHEGFGNEVAGSMGAEEFKAFLRATRHPFVEVLADLQPDNLAFAEDLRYSGKSLPSRAVP